MAKTKMRHRLKRFVDVSAWLGTDEIKRNTGNLKRLAKMLFTVQKPEIQETFAEAIKRHKMTEQDIELKQKHYLITSLLCFVVCLLIMGYTIHLFIVAHYMSFAMSAMVCLLSFAFFFKEHFWYTQIKHRRLGFTFFEWFKSIFK
jgi:intracellular multiplication protein IcmV